MWGRLQPRTFVRFGHLWSWSEQQCYHCSLSTNSTRITWICDLASISLLMFSVWGFYRPSHARKKSRVFPHVLWCFFPPGCLYVLLLLYSLLYCFRLIFCRSFKLDVECMETRCAKERQLCEPQGPPPQRPVRSSQTSETRQCLGIGQIRNLPLALLALPEMPALPVHFAKSKHSIAFKIISYKFTVRMSGWLLYTLACDISGWPWMRLKNWVYLLGALNSGRSFSLHLRVRGESSKLMEVPNSADLRHQGHHDDSIMMASWWHHESSQWRQWMSMHRILLDFIRCI